VGLKNLVLPRALDNAIVGASLKILFIFLLTYDISPKSEIETQNFKNEVRF